MQLFIFHFKSFYGVSATFPVSTLPKLTRPMKNRENSAKNGKKSYAVKNIKQVAFPKTIYGVTLLY